VRAFVSPNGITSHLNEPLLSVEGGFPFFTFCYANKVVSMMQVNFCECMGFAWCIKEVRNKRKWIMILLANLVKPTIVNTRS